MARHAALVLTLLTVLKAPAVAAEPAACADPLLSVDAPGEATVGRVCAAALRAKDELATCGLTQTRPVTIEIRPEIDGPADHCAGLYACGSDRIALIPPDAVGRIMPPDSYFAALAPNAYYDSLVVHELAHALMDQAGCSAPRCAADKEYVAYAMQIRSLPEAERAGLLDQREVRSPVDRQALNDLVLGFKPDIFALLAWAHFDMPGNGCAFVARLVGGDATLALPAFLE